MEMLILVIIASAIPVALIPYAIGLYTLYVAYQVLRSPRRKGAPR